MTDNTINNIIFALGSPEYFGTKEERERIISMLKSTDEEMIRLGITIITEKVKLRYNGEEPT